MSLTLILFLCGVGGLIVAILVFGAGKRLDNWFVMSQSVVVGVISIICITVAITRGM